MRLEQLISEALNEDVGQGDITSEACLDQEQTGTALIRAKQELVVCGHDVAKEVFRQMGTTYTPLVKEGVLIKATTPIASIQGKIAKMLTAERVALNFLMRLCGIATHTYSVSSRLKGHLRLVDTRKTTPLLRQHERRAVRIGGGHNHRYALYDGILIKENHIKAAGSVSAAVQLAKQNAHHLLKIEIEVESFEQLKEAAAAGADVVMLDNMSDQQLKEAVSFRNDFAPGLLLEASGNMTADRAVVVEEIGVDIVSMGGLIHQATWADLSMKLTSVD